MTVLAAMRAAKTWERAGRLEEPPDIVLIGRHENKARQPRSAQTHKPRGHIIFGSLASHAHTRRIFEDLHAVCTPARMKLPPPPKYAKTPGALPPSAYDEKMRLAAMEAGGDDRPPAYSPSSKFSRRRYIVGAAILASLFVLAGLAIAIAKSLHSSTLTVPGSTAEASIPSRPTLCSRPHQNTITVAERPQRRGVRARMVRTRSRLVGRYGRRRLIQIVVLSVSVVALTVTALVIYLCLKGQPLSMASGSSTALVHSPDSPQITDGTITLSVSQIILGVVVVVVMLAGIGGAIVVYRRCCRQSACKNSHHQKNEQPSLHDGELATKPSLGGSSVPTGYPPPTDKRQVHVWDHRGVCMRGFHNPSESLSEIALRGRFYESDNVNYSSSDYVFICSGEKLDGAVKLSEIASNRLDHLYIFHKDDKIFRVFSVSANSRRRDSSRSFKDVSLSELEALSDKYHVAADEQMHSRIHGPATAEDVLKQNYVLTMAPASLGVYALSSSKFSLYTDVPIINGEIDPQPEEGNRRPANANDNK